MAIVSVITDPTALRVVHHQQPGQSQGEGGGAELAVGAPQQPPSGLDWLAARRGSAYPGDYLSRTWLGVAGR
jgi:hypothetical protein